MEAESMIRKALAAEYIYNADDIGGSSGRGSFFFGQDTGGTSRR